MSMTLILWKAPVVADEDEAKKLLEAWYETGDESAFELSEDVRHFIEEVRAHYPDDVESVDELSPWSSWPIPDSDRVAELNIRWSANDSVFDVIEQAARDFGLILYDPQGPSVFLPTDPLPSDEPIEEPTLLDHLKIVAMAAILGALTYAAWLIPIGWLRWPALIVAGFMFISSLIVVYAMIAAALGWIDVEEGRRATCTPDEPSL